MGLNADAHFIKEQTILLGGLSRIPQRVEAKPGGGGGGNQGFQSLSAPPSQPHLWPSWAREAAETSTPLVTVTHFSALQGVRHHSKPPKSFCY